MNNPHPQSTLRELRTHLTTPATFVVLLSVSAVLGLVGPFETAIHLRLLPRALYWLVVVLSTYSIGYAASFVLRRWRGRLWPRPVVAVASGIATGFGVTVMIFAINLASFGDIPTPKDDLPLVATLFAISIIISVAMDYLLVGNGEAVPPEPERAPPPSILDRVPIEKRAALVALSVEDHYVRIRTEKGEEIVLMRLADAMREVGTVAGTQVHRSHWIAFDQVRDVRREGDRAVLTMSDTSEIPVSRTNLPKLRDAGLLPK